MYDASELDILSQALRNSEEAICETVDEYSKESCFEPTQQYTEAFTLEEVGTTLILDDKLLSLVTFP